MCADNMAAFAGEASDVPTNVTIASSTFSGNAATDRGGAVNLQAGNLIITDTTFSNNQATAATISDVGTGGALSVIDACNAARCPTAVANVRSSTFTNNYAFQAGGAVFYRGANTGMQADELTKIPVKHMQ